MAIDMRERLAALAESPSVEGLQEIDAAVQRTADNWTDPVRAGVMYFRVPDKRMPRGRITLLQNGMNAMEMVQYRDYQMLSRYGGYKSANQISDWQRNDPYLGIVQRGGIHEFGPEQIISQQWHFKPGRDALGSHRFIWESIETRRRQGLSDEESILAVMPQLVGFDLKSYACDFCPGRAFTSEQSVRNHESVMHKEDVRSRETRDSVSSALEANGSGKAMEMIAQALQMLAANGMQMPAAEAQKRGPGRPRKDDDTPSTE